MTLAVTSIEEDTYGYVQQVLPATLEAIVRLRLALLSLSAELSSQASLLGRGQAGAMATSASRVDPLIEGEHGSLLCRGRPFSPPLRLLPPSPLLSLHQTYPLMSACETAVQRIGDRFGNSLSAFRFPPTIATTLTDICRSGSCTA